jgi:DNA repair ATPase RecN
MSLDLSIEFLRKLDKLQPELKEILYSLFEELEKHREKSVSKDEFNELKAIVKELALSQKELAEAQKRTEKRVEELAEAQKRTEKRVEELAEAQKRTEKRVEELAEAQKRTEEELKTLSRELKTTRKEVGGLSTTIGYTLENESYKKLPKLLEKDFGITIKEKLKRTYVKDISGNEVEVNIFGHGEKGGNPVTIIGEAKSQLSRNDIDRFLKKKFKRLEGLYPEVLLVLVTHMITSSSVEEYMKEKEIALYYSYDF